MLWEISESFDFEKIPYPYNEAIKEQLKLNWKLMIKIIGKMAEQEIKDKGARVRQSVKQKDGKAVSYKGRKWGRKSLPQKVINEVLQMYEKGHSLRDIADDVTYYDKNRNLRKISLGSVHKIIKQNTLNTQS